MLNRAETPENPQKKSGLRCRAHGEFSAWLAASGGSLAITTYTSGKLVLVTTREGRIRFRTYKFPRPMGMAIHGKQLALAIRRASCFTKIPTRESSPFSKSLPRERWMHTTSPFGRRGIYFANTRFNCIARAEAKKHFLRSWQPPFVPKSATRDHCHLNGLWHEARTTCHGHCLLCYRQASRLARRRSLHQRDSHRHSAEQR